MHDTKRVRLRRDRYDALMKLRDLTYPAAQARALGVSQPTVQRVLDGENYPGGRFIGSVLAFFSGMAFEDLFEVVADEVEVTQVVIPTGTNRHSSDYHASAEANEEPAESSA